MITEEEIRLFNIRQKSGAYHPLTCGNNRTDAKHLDGEGILILTKHELRCPFCDYRQDWKPYPKKK